MFEVVLQVRDAEGAACGGRVVQAPTPETLESSRQAVEAEYPAGYTLTEVPSAADLELPSGAVE